MHPPSLRRFWQLHLSTAIVLALLSGVFLSLNVEPESLPFARLLDGLNDFESDFGWPLPVRNYVEIGGVACYSRASRDGKFLYVYKPNGSGAFDSYTFDNTKTRAHYNGVKLVLNALCCAILLVVVGLAFELLLKRREARNH